MIGWGRAWGAGLAYCLCPCLIRLPLPSTPHVTLTCPYLPAPATTAWRPPPPTPPPHPPQCMQWCSTCPLAYMEDLGFGELVLVESFAVSMSGARCARCARCAVVLVLRVCQFVGWGVLLGEAMSAFCSVHEREKGSPAANLPPVPASPPRSAIPPAVSSVQAAAGTSPPTFSTRQACRRGPCRRHWPLS